jgi:hypothetical protein
VVPVNLEDLLLLSRVRDIVWILILNDNFTDMLHWDKMACKEDILHKLTTEFSFISCIQEEKSYKDEIVLFPIVAQI